MLVRSPKSRPAGSTPATVAKWGCIDLSFAQTAEELGLKLPPEVVRACLYLERAGFVFCVHFGYDNAVDKARAHWRARRRRRGRNAVR